MTSDSHPRLFVTGAAGQLGRLLIRELLKRVPASSIVAGVRSPDHEVVGRFKGHGIEVRVADYAQPDTLTKAFEGIDRLLLISSTAGGDRVAQHQNVINAAKSANVGLLAYTSLLHADRAMSGWPRTTRSLKPRCGAQVCHSCFFVTAGTRRTTPRPCNPRFGMGP